MPRLALALLVLALLTSLAGCSHDPDGKSREQRDAERKRDELSKQSVAALAVPQPWSEQQKAYVGWLGLELRRAESAVAAGQNSVGFGSLP